MSLVLDASATLAWALGERVDDRLQTIFEDVARAGAVVPSIWWLEVANVLTVACRRRRISSERRREILLNLNAFPILSDRETELRAWSDTLRLADQYLLTVYDASYLELAVRKEMPLATLGQDLAQAARAADVLALL